MSQYLPPGITDSMLEPSDDLCASCGHPASYHIEEEQDQCDHINCDCEKYIEGEYDPYDI